MIIRNAARLSVLGTTILGLIACSTVQVHQTTVEREDWDGKKLHFETRCKKESEDKTKNPCESYACKGTEGKVSSDSHLEKFVDCGDPVATCKESQLDPRTRHCPGLTTNGLDIAYFEEILRRGGRDELRSFLASRANERSFGFTAEEKVTDTILERYENVGINLAKARGKAEEINVFYDDDTDGIKCEANNVSKTDVFVLREIPKRDKRGRILRNAKKDLEIVLDDNVNGVTCWINEDYADEGERIYQVRPRGKPIKRRSSND